jgi:hypothetical protein
MVQRGFAAGVAAGAGGLAARGAGSGAFAAVVTAGVFAAGVFTAGAFTNCFVAAALLIAGLPGAAFFAAMALLKATLADASAAFAAANASCFGTALTAVANWPAFDLIEAATAGSILGVTGLARLTGAMIGSMRCAVAGATAVGAATLGGRAEAADGICPGCDWIGGVWAVATVANWLKSAQAIPVAAARDFNVALSDFNEVTFDFNEVMSNQVVKLLTMLFQPRCLTRLSIPTALGFFIK